MRGADQPPRRQGQQMADADYDFGGGFSSERQAPRQGAREAVLEQKSLRDRIVLAAATHENAVHCRRLFRHLGLS